LRAVHLSRSASFGAARPALRAVLAALVVAACFASHADARPPLPPLEVKLEALDPLLPGHAARFRWSAVPRFPGDEIRVEIVSGPSIRWMSGVRTFRARALRDVSLERVFSVRVPERGREALYVRFEATGPNGVVWKRGAGLGLGPESPWRSVSDGRGGQAVEYDAAPARAQR